MNHNQINTDVAAIRRAHGQFLEKGIVPEGIVPDFIKRSWQRSVDFGVPYDRIREVARIDETDLRVAVSQYGSLINLASPVMENLHQQLAGSGSVVLLCSGDGLILHSLGDPDFIPKAQHVALKPGVSWAEEQKGTNAIGTAIVEREPVVIYAGHHFIRQNHFLACSATPVLDPCGEVAGVLDITCDYRGHQRHTIALVQMAVRVIERQMFQHRFCRDLVFNVHPERNYLGSPFDVQVAFSPDGVYLAATPATCGQLDLQPGTFRGSFDELFDTSLEQVLRKLGSVSPPVIPARMRHNGSPVYLQLAQPAVVAKPAHGTPVTPPAQPRATPHESPQTLSGLTLDALGTERRHLPKGFLEELSPAPTAASVREAVTAQCNIAPLRADSLEQIELHAIQETIRHCNGNISAAARQLHVSRTTLYRKLKSSLAMRPDHRVTARRRRDDPQR